MSTSSRNVRIRTLKPSSWDRAFIVADYAVMTVLMLVCLYPFYYLIIYSLSEPGKAYGHVFLIPYALSLETYLGVFSINFISRAMIVSVARTLIGTAITVSCSALLAYVLNQRELPRRKLLYRLLVITMYFNAGLIPWYMTLRMLGLRDTFWLYILPGAVSAFFVVLNKTYFQSIPPSLEESAKIDGAGWFRVFTGIIVPLSKPILMTTVIFGAVNQWNSWADNYFLAPSRSLRTLQLVLYDYLMESARMSQLSADALYNLMETRRLVITPEAIKAAITVIVTTPIILLYPFLQKHLAKGLMIGAIKG